MSLHERKNCQRCNAVFECKAGNIAQCQCAEFVITVEIRTYLEQRYNDCVCKNCFQYLQVELNFFKPQWTLSTQRGTENSRINL